MIATVHLHVLVWVQEVHKDFVEYCDVIELSGGVRALDPHQMASVDADAKLVPECRLTSILVQTKCVAFSGSSLLLDLEVSAIDTHQAVIVDVIILPTFEVNL
jgi:hypothetical protein